MAATTYWLDNGAEVEGPFSWVELAKFAEDGILKPEAKVMPLDGTEWIPRGDLTFAKRKIKEVSKVVTKPSAYEYKPSLIEKVKDFTRTMVAGVVGLFIMIGGLGVGAAKIAKSATWIEKVVPIFRGSDQWNSHPKVPDFVLHENDHKPAQSPKSNPSTSPPPH